MDDSDSNFEADPPWMKTIKEKEREQKKEVEKKEQKKKKKETPKQEVITTKTDKKEEKKRKERELDSKKSSFSEEHEVTDSMKESPRVLEVESISTEKKLKPWWNSSSMEISKNLSSVSKTDLQDLDMSPLNKYATGLTAPSWFSSKMKDMTQKKSLLETYLPSLQFSFQDTMDSDLEKRSEEEKKTKKPRLKKNGEPVKTKNPAQKCMKIKLLPSKEEKEKLNQWMGASRWTYNQCLDAIKTKGIKKNQKELRGYCINKDSEIVKKNQWCNDIPYDIRDEGMCDLLKAYKTCFSSKKKFDIQFKSKKDGRDSIVIRSKHYKRKKGPYSMISKMKSTEPLPLAMEYDSRLTKDHLNQYWLCVPIRFPLKSLDNQETLNRKDRIAAIDPGVRTFATIYDTNGSTLEVGKNDIGRIYRLGCVVDKLQSEWSQKETKHKKRYRLKRAAKQIRKKIKNLVKDVHCKLIKYLCLNYEVILLPKFDTKGMISKSKRKISSKTARAIITWSHFTFRERLLNKVKEYPLCKVKLVTEEYTSQTCGSCGKLNDKLGSKKDFECPFCDYKADRDLNAARNILIKSLQEALNSVVGAYTLYEKS
jgi:putative transposase